MISILSVRMKLFVSPLKTYDSFLFIDKGEYVNINAADLFTTTFSPYLLRFFTVNYALRLNLTILRLNKHRFFKIRLYRKGHTVIDHSERHNF